MHLREERNEFYVPPSKVKHKKVEYQTKNLGIPVFEVSQQEFIERIFGSFSGHLCFFQKFSDGRKRNVLYDRKDQKKIYSFLEKTFGVDTYISYSTYFKKYKTKKEEKIRTQSNIVNTHILVQDLDYYKFGMTDGEVLKEIGKMIENEEILCPNFFISTGRGYQLIWILEAFKNIKGYANDLDWRRIQEHLYLKMKRFNTDHVVKNATAVTRMQGTKHRKSGKKVHSYLGNEKVFTLKDFIFFHGLIPTPDRKVEIKKQDLLKRKEAIKPAKISRITGQWNEFTLNRQREEDIFIFVEEKNRRDENYIGIRNWLALVLRFHALVSTGGNKEYAEKRVIDLCNQMDMTETTEGEILRRSEGAETYYKDWLHGTWDREKYIRGGLFYTNRRMLDLMGIKEDYHLQWKMKTIKVKNKAYEASRKRFEKFSEEEASMHTWQAYQKRRNKHLESLKQTRIKSLQAKIKENPTLSQRKLAAQLGWSLETTRKYLKINGNI